MRRTKERDTIPEPTKQPTPTGKPGRPVGKPPGDEKKAREAALLGLQKALDRACACIHDGGSSYARKARIASKRGIPRTTVEAGLEALKAAIADAEKVVHTSYSLGTASVQTSRATLKV